jgi:hypothetical protein
MGGTGDPKAAPSAASSFRAGSSREEREELISRLLAERRAKVGGAAGASSASAASSFAAGSISATYFAHRAGAVFSAAVESALNPDASYRSSGSFAATIATAGEGRGPGRPSGEGSSSGASAARLKSPSASGSASASADSGSSASWSSSSGSLLNTLGRTHGPDSHSVLQALRAQVAERFGTKKASTSSANGSPTSERGGARVTFAKSPLPSPPAAKAPRHAVATAAVAAAPAAAAPPAPAIAPPLPPAAQEGSSSSSSISSSSAKSAAVGSSSVAAAGGKRSSSAGPSAASASRVSSASASPKESKGRGRTTSSSRLAELARDKSVVYAQREKNKAAEEAEQLASQCTFQPKVSSGGGQQEQQQQVGGGEAFSGGGYGSSAAREYLEGGGRSGPASLGVMVDAASAIGGTAPSPPPKTLKQQQQQQLKQQQHQQQQQQQQQAGRAAPPIAPAVNTTSVVKRLYEEADRRALKQAQAKAAVERAASAAFTFKPSINPTSRAILEEKEVAAAAAGGGGGPAGGYLSVGGWGAYAGLAAAAAAGGGGGGGGGARVPLFQRTEAVVRESAESLHRLRMESQSQGAAAQCTFRPKINPTSAKLAAQHRDARQQRGGGEGGGLVDLSPTPGSGRGGGEEGISERLLREAGEREAKLAAMRRAREEVETGQCPFAPKINTEATGELVRARLARLEGGGVIPPATSAAAPGFFERLAMHASAGERGRAALEAACAAERGFSFKPDIGNAEEMLAVLRPERVLESQAARLERLAVKDAQDKAAALEAQQRAAAAAYTFKPEINSVSRALGKAHTVEELNANETGARAKLKAAAVQEAEFLAKHPFKPALVSSATAAAAAAAGSADSGAAAPHHEPLPERVAEVKAVVEAKREELRRKAEYDELAPCTFAPSTEASKASLAKLKQAAAENGGVVVVRGLGRHLELKELKRQIEEEKKCVQSRSGWLFWRCRPLKSPYKKTKTTCSHSQQRTP